MSLCVVCVVEDCVTMCCMCHHVLYVQVKTVTFSSMKHRWRMNWRKKLVSRGTGSLSNSCHATPITAGLSCNSHHSRPVMQLPSQQACHATPITAGLSCNSHHSRPVMQLPSQQACHATPITAGLSCNYGHDRPVMQLRSRQACHATPVTTGLSCNYHHDRPIMQLPPRQACQSSSLSILHPLSDVW